VEVITVLITSSYHLSLIEKRTAYLKIVITDAAETLP